MNNCKNYSSDGKYYISTAKSNISGVWETGVFPVDAESGVVQYGKPLELISHYSEDSAYAHHYRTVTFYSQEVHHEDVLGIGEGFY